jgi:hypothetical protein
MSEVTDAHLEEIDALFVQSSKTFSSNDGTITLNGLADSTLYFSDRPMREFGHLGHKQFVELWTRGANSFADDPPNAVISFLELEEFAPVDAVVVLRDPELGDGSISYQVDVLEGHLPEDAGPCSLFIDTFGRPLTPISLMGIRRRQRRRMRRGMV